MKKSLIVSALLFSFCAAQGMQQRKSDIEMYAKKAASIAYSPAAYHSVYKGGNVTDAGREMQAWSGQLSRLKSLLSEKTLYLGVPEGQQSETPTWNWRLFNYWFGNYKQLAKQYILVKDFGDTKNAFNLNHYEVYFMPDDIRLYDLCHVIVNNTNHFFKQFYNKDAKNYIAFIAVRPTPGITKSPYDGGNMPRIVVGFKPLHVTAELREIVENFIYYLSETTKGTGCLGAPRHSVRFQDSCVFWRHGSPDNSVLSEKSYRNKSMDDNTRLFKCQKTPAGLS